MFVCIFRLSNFIRTVGVEYQQIFTVGLVQRRLHRDHRGVQSHGSCGKTGRVELQRVRDEKGCGYVRDHTRPGQVSQAAAVHRPVRREVFFGETERLGALVPDGARKERRQYLPGRVAHDRRAHSYSTGCPGYSSTRGARRLPTRKHQTLSVSIIIMLPPSLGHFDDD